MLLLVMVCVVLLVLSGFGLLYLWCFGWFCLFGDFELSGLRLSGFCWTAVPHCL